MREDLYIRSPILLFVHIPMMYAQNQATPNPLDADLAVICTPFPYVVPYCFSPVGEEKK